MTGIDVVRNDCHTPTGSGRAYPAARPTHPPTLELSPQTVRALPVMDYTQARLLPRYRPAGLLELRERQRAQARVVLDETERNEHATFEQTKGGGTDTLRGIPAIARSVRGVINGTDPYDETARRDTQAQRLRDKTELAA